MVVVNKLTPSDVFRTYCACGTDRKPYYLDLRPNKDYKKSHLSQSFNVTLSKNGRIIVDYSKATYKNVAFSQGCWWDKDVILYGSSTVRDEEAVMAFLLAEGRVRTVGVLVGGFPSFEAKYKFLCTSNTRKAEKTFPSEILPGFVFLGTWEHAEDHEILKSLKIGGVLTIHNTPENLKVPAGVAHLKMTLADVESEDIAQFFDDSFQFFNLMKNNKRMLVHCGAGVSRSATLIMAFLIRQHGLTAQAALEFCQKRRSIVLPNEGFMKQLRDYDIQIHKTSDKFEELDVTEPIISTSQPNAKAGAGLVAMYTDEDAEPAAPSSQSHQAGDVDGHSAAPAAAAPPQGFVHQSKADKSSKPPEDRKRKADDTPKIVVYKGQEVVESLAVKAGRKCTFGSQPDCGVIMQHASISRHHAQISASEDFELTIEDLGSSNGTFLDGRKLTAREKVKLEDGSKIRFGASTRVYKVHFPTKERSDDRHRRHSPASKRHRDDSYHRSSDHRRSDRDDRRHSDRDDRKRYDRDDRHRRR